MATRGNWHTRSGPAGEVGRITVLANMERSNEAQALLKKIHSMVKPVMKLHGWFLPTLAEFFPDQTNLLGVNYNAGQRICIRLRPHYDSNSFLSLEDSLIPTMLHELTHNHRGPHDRIFDAFLKKLTDDLTGYRVKGFIDFSGHGIRLGAGAVQPRLGLDIREARIQRIEYLQKQKALLGHGGRLGGSGPARFSRAAIARAAERRRIANKAAERRRKATLGCGGDKKHPGGSDRQHQKPGILAELDRAARESIVIDLTRESDDVDGDDGDDLIVLAREPDNEHGKGGGGSGGGSDTPRGHTQSASPGSSGSHSSGSVASARNRGDVKRKPAPASPSLPSHSSTVILIDDDSDDEIQVVSMKPAKPSDKRKAIPQQQPRRGTLGSGGAGSRFPAVGKTATQPPIIPTTWTCPKCTLINSADSPACEACPLKLAPVHPNKASMYLFVAEGWVCEFAGCLTLNGQEWWSCGICRAIKTDSAKG